MATPFSPFVNRVHKPSLKRRQSELPSDLIDWDAPVMPELEKQRIVYEDHIKEITEDHEVEVLLKEQTFVVAYETVVDEYQSRVKNLEEELSRERSRVHLLLGQIKMFESTAQVNDERIDELESDLSSKRTTITSFEKEKQNWIAERESLQNEIETLTFKNNETICESNHNLELYIRTKHEVENLTKNLTCIKNQLSHFKKLAKGRDV